MNYQEEFNKQKSITEGIFNELFGFGKKEPQNGVFFEKDGVYYFGGGRSTAERINQPSTLGFLQNFNWEGSKLKFVVSPETQFHAKLMNFDLEKEIITFFKGEWLSGGFRGTEFFGVFQGDYFIGRFTSSNTTYKSDPTTFIEGTFYDSQNGILGLQNTLSFAQTQPVELISIPVGHMLTIKTKNGTECMIRVLKRLDANNSQFIYEVVKKPIGYDQTITKEVVEWPKIREYWSTGIYKISLSSKNIAGLFEIPSGDQITEIYISESKETPTTSSNLQKDTFQPGKKYQFDLKSIPYLDIKQLRGNKGQFLGNSSNSLINLSFDSEAEFSEYEKILNSIKSGQFAQDIKNINRAIRYGEVDGYGPYVYLKKVFNDIKGVNSMNLDEAKRPLGQMQPNIAPGKIRKSASAQDGQSSGAQKNSVKTQEKGISVADSMSRVSNFVKFFTSKTAMGTDVLVAPQANIPQPGQQADPNFVNQFKMQESVRKIIKDHF